MSRSYALVTFGDGHAEKWNWTGTAYEGAPGVLGTAAKNGDGSFDLTQKDQTRYHFATDGSLAWAEDRNGNRTTLSYDAQGRLTSVAEPAGRALTFAYASPISATLISQVGDPAGRTLQFTYNISGELVSAVDTTGATTTMAYDADHRLLSIAVANGHTFVRNVYVSRGRVAEQYDALNNKTTFAYDAANRLIATQDALGYTTVYTYDRVGNRVATQDALGRVAGYGYDEKDRLAVVTDTLGNATRYAYDANNNQTSITDPLGRTTTFAYDALNRRIAATDPLGNTTSYQYDANGNRTRVTDANGRATTYIYDARNRVVSVIDAAGGTVSYAYDANSNRIATTDPNGHTTSHAYDSLNRLSLIVDPLDNTTAYQCDAVGNTATTRDANGQITSFAYDALNRLVNRTSPLGITTSITYDAVGNRVSRTDGNGQTTNFSYDVLNRLIEVTAPLSNSWQFTYDAVGNRTAIRDPNNNTVTYGFDAANRLSLITDPFGQTLRYSYDLSGRKEGQTDAMGHTITYTYNAAGRLTAISYPTFAVQLAYDAVGNRKQMVDPSGTTTYAYDALDRPTTITYDNGDTVRLAYNAAGNRTGITYPDGSRVSYVYDPANRLSGVTDWAGEIITYDYNPIGNLTVTTRPNGTNTEYTYDADNRLLTLVHSSAVSGTLSAFSYTYDRAGSRTAIESESSSDRFAYDANGRLVGAVYGADEPSSVLYQYDGVGNRVFITETISGAQVSTAYAHDAANRLVRVTQPGDTVDYTWDANGNLTGDGLRSFAWDAANRLISVTVGADSNAYTYNGDGWRLSQTMNGITRTYRYFPLEGLPFVLTERQGSQTTRYAYGTDIVIRDDPTAGRQFYHADGLGSISNLSNVAGQEIAGYRYDAFGSVRDQSGSSANNLLFVAQQLDSSGMYFSRARYYDPSTGRFLSRDPQAGDPERPNTLHPYAYAANNPLNFVDLSGESFEQWWTNTTGFWAEMGQQVKAAGQIAWGAATGDEASRLAAGYIVQDVGSGAVWQRLPDAATRTVEAIDFPKGMRESANDAFEAASYFEQNGQYSEAWGLRALGGLSWSGSVAVDILATPLKAGKVTANTMEMTSGVLTGQRSTEQALSTAAGMGLELAGPYVSRWLLGDLVVGPCQYGSVACEELRKQFIRTDPNLSVIGKLTGKAFRWNVDGAGKLLYVESFPGSSFVGGGGGGSWGTPPSRGK